MKIPFNQPFLVGNELAYITDAVKTKKLSGNGKYTQLCQEFFCRRYGFKKCLLTSSCTDALEMAAILIGVGPGDEVIMPSYTFVSTANAFILRGCKVVFADSGSANPNIDVRLLQELINERTKAIVVVHYAGIACDMDAIMDLARRHNLYVIEDAAQAIDSYYKNIPLGSIGHLSTFSFHETKNVTAGEGGMLVINDDRFLARSEIIWEKGTNRSAFWRGEVDKYGWVDIGSSFLPSEIVAAFLYAQLENLDAIQKRRKEIWEIYYSELCELGKSGRIGLPAFESWMTNNAHMFYLLCADLRERDQLIDYLKKRGVNAVFHYQPLHRSPYYANKHDGRHLANCDRYADCLVRLPFFYEIQDEQVRWISESIHQFYQMV
jgi:dTDP-4-amino-4,6-dideoxygalactose transaminase